MSQTARIIHREIFFSLTNVLPSLLILLAWGFFIWFPGDRGATFPLILFTAIMLVVTVITSFRGANFLVFDDRIELRRPFSRKPRGVIWLSRVAQVRYEDEFSGPGLLSDYLLLYPAQNADKAHFSNDRLALTVSGIHRKANTLKLLKFFQTKGIEVVVKTHSKKILSETGLKSWDRV